MTPQFKQGRDDVLENRIDSKLFDADSNEGREYRDGRRAARRDAEDREAASLTIAADSLRDIVPANVPKPDSDQLDLFK